MSRAPRYFFLLALAALAPACSLEDLPHPLSDAARTDLRDASDAPDTARPDVTGDRADACTTCGASCVDLSSDPDHCGACGTACTRREACVSGVCTRCRDTENPCGNVCTNVATDPANCGACGRTCETHEHQVAACAAGTCATVCSAGYAECNGVSTDGCEVLTTDPANCGGCRLACPVPPNSVATCTAATPGTMPTCGSRCAEGFADCNGMASDGCEVDTRTSPTHCGRCATACPARDGATATCTAGACGFACATGSADCDRSAANGCEVNTQTSASSCGACGTACAAREHSAAACVAGACALGACEAGFANCNGVSTDGCETGTRTDTANCGACGTVCSLPHATETCAAGACAVGACEAGFVNCNGMASDGCEVDSRTDTANCGACGARCPTGQFCSAGACRTDCGALTLCTSRCADLSSDAANCGGCGVACPTRANARPTCASRICGFDCQTNYADCDRAAANGCEVTLPTDPSNCGACGRACTAGPNATPTCTAGTCGYACAAGYADCDGNPANGCETQPATSASHCGACGRACPSPSNAAPTCSAGTCGFACGAGYADCDHDQATGCEVNTRTSTANCGACGAACPARDHATAACVSGACGVTCNPGFGDCDSNTANGCETDTQTSGANCGACGRACAAGPNATATCTAGACRTACNPGYGDCDGNTANGCETDLRTSLTSCGACGVACRPPNATGACTAGVCGVASCNAGFGDCTAAEGCETSLASATNCGRCGNACSAGTVCNGATCGSVCSAPLMYCAVSAACFNLQTDVSNCGSCGNACTSPAHTTPTCGSGTCSFVCATDYGNCDGVSGNGCEAALQSDPSHCGSCAGACSLANAAPSCVSGHCAIASCNPGFGNCDGNPLNGCETALSTDGNNCGSCGRVCPPDAPHSASRCTSGACAMVCVSGWENCDGIGSNGCETDPQNDRWNCGSCGLACAAGHNCVSGVCVVGCTGSLCSDGRLCASGSCVNCDATRPCPSGSTCDEAAGRCQTLCSTSSQCPTGQVCSGGRCGPCAPGSACGPGATCNSSGVCVCGDADGDGVTALSCGGSDCDDTRVSVHPGAAEVCDNALDENCNGLTDESCAPRPVSPLSTATVTSRTPTLRWVLGSSSDGARVQICSARGCPVATSIEQTLEVTGTSTVVPTQLSPGVHYWRLFRRDGSTTPATVGSTASPSWEFFVGTRSASISASMGTVPDFNGDGRADLVAGVPANSPPRVLVWYGSPAGLSSSASGDVVLLNPATTRFGYALTSAGDVNGDGLADLLVGSQNNKVSLFLGREAGLDTLPSADRTSSVSNFGEAVAAAGDVNGDGYADVAVGAHGNAQVMLYYGSATGLPTSPSATLTGTGAPTSRFGSALASAGDYDLDGFGDLLVGEPGYNSQTGRVWLYRGSASGLQPTAATLPGNAGASTGDSFGYAVAGPGDFNGDGRPDFLVGAYGVSSSTGAVTLFRATATSGTGNFDTQTFAGPGASSYFGMALANVGDTNRDGYDDFAVGAPNHPSNGRVGRVSLYVGGTTLASTPNAWFAGPDGSATDFGTSLAPSGDFNGDGYFDLAVGATGYATGAGRIYVFLGLLDGTNTPSRTYTGSSGSELGRVLAGLSLPRLLPTIRRTSPCRVNVLACASASSPRVHREEQVPHAGVWRARDLHHRVEQDGAKGELPGQDQRCRRGHGLRGPGALRAEPSTPRISGEDPAPRGSPSTWSARGRPRPPRSRSRGRRHERWRLAG